MKYHAHLADDLSIPGFLRTGKRKPYRAPRPRPMVARHPEGERWIDAERWEVSVPPEWSDRGVSGLGIGSGRRYVWVATGRKWAYLRDNEGQIKVPVEEWYRVTKQSGRKVS